MLVVMNSDDGKLIASLPTIAKVDDIAYDAGHRRIYVAGDHFIEVFQQERRST